MRILVYGMPVLLVSFIFALVGCQSKAVHTDGSFDVGTTSLNNTKKAVVILGMGFTDKPCRDASMTLGQKSGNSITPYRKIHLNYGFNLPTDAKYQNFTIAALPAGDYHIIRFSCRNGGDIEDLDAGTKGVFSQVYKRGYASFKVKSNEVVNVGYLAGTHFGEHARLRARKLPKEAVAVLKTKHPVLHKKMAKRLMKGPNSSKSAVENLLKKKDWLDKKYCNEQGYKRAGSNKKTLQKFCKEAKKI